MENVLDILGGVKDYAHRGCFDKTLPENSLTAIRIAADKGLGLEIDVHLTKDNKLVVFHDHALKRMCGVSGIVEEMTESQLTALKLKNTSHTIPTLKDVLAAVDGRTPILIELKCRNNEIALCDALIDELKSYNGKYMYIGFNEKAAKYFKDKGYTIALSCFKPKTPKLDFKPDFLLCNILGIPRSKKKRAKYPPFISWTIESGSLLDSVKYRGEEYLWQGSEKSWKSKDIVIFPFVARLKDGWYTVDGKRYEMKNHGLARYNVFTAESNTGDTLVMDFKSTEETKKQYPFDFDFKVKYALVENSMKITYTVVNTGDVDMPFGLGTHFGWALVGDETDDTCDVSGNFAIIDTDKPIEEYEFDDDLHLVKGEKKSEFTNEIPLVKSTFIHDAVVTKNNAKKVTLLRRDGKKITFDIGNVPVLAIWSNNKMGKYACIEAWWGLPDTVDCDRELKNKFLINTLPAGKTFEYEVTVTF